MEKIIKTYKQSVPAMRFIGKKYDVANGDWGDFGEWFGNDWFGVIERAAGGAEIVNKLYEDGGAYIYMTKRTKNSEVIEAWIGIFVAPDVKVPDGFLSIDYPAQSLGVCWMYGDDIQTYKLIAESGQKIEAEGMEIRCEEDGSIWSFSRDGCPRFTIPDENGNVIRDYCYFVK